MRSRPLQWSFDSVKFLLRHIGFLSWLTRRVKGQGLSLQLCEEQQAIYASSGGQCPLVAVCPQQGQCQSLAARGCPHLSLGELQKHWGNMVLLRLFFSAVCQELNRAVRRGSGPNPNIFNWFSQLVIQDIFIILRTTFEWYLRSTLTKDQIDFEQAVS